MDIKQIVEKLKSIRQDYEDKKISMATAGIIGKYYVDKYNEYSRQIAKKYNTPAKVIPNNVKFYPSN